MLANIPDGVVETMNWGMIAYEIPLTRYPDTYNGQPPPVASAATKLPGAACRRRPATGRPIRRVTDQRD